MRAQTSVSRVRLPAGIHFFGLAVHINSVIYLCHIHIPSAHLSFCVCLNVCISARVRGRRCQLNPPQEQGSIEDEDDDVEKLKEKFGFWADFHAASNDNNERKNLPALLIQQADGKDKDPVPCRVSIEVGEQAQSTEEKLGSANIVPATPLPGATPSIYSPAAFEPQGDPPVFIQIIHAFDATRYIIKVAEGRLIIQDVNVPLEQQKSKLDQRRLLLMQTEDTSEGQQMRVCTLIFSSPGLRKVFRKLCAQHGYKQDIADMVCEDGRTKKKWKFYRNPEDNQRVMLGKGSFARVFKAKMSREQQLPTELHDEIIAVKELIHYDLQPIVSQFQNEIRTLNQLHHENIIKIFGSDNSPDTGAPCILLELVQGGDLKDCVNLYGPVWEPSNPTSETVVAWYAFQLTSAVAYLHGKQIMSRDIKDENCMINKFTGRLVLIDFGTHKDMHGLQVVTASFVGTPSTMSDARLVGKPYGMSEDVYSIGCVVRQLVASANPLDKIHTLRDFKVYKKETVDADTIKKEWPKHTKAVLHACFEDSRTRPTAQKLLETCELFKYDFTQFDPRRGSNTGPVSSDTSQTKKTGTLRLKTMYSENYRRIQVIKAFLKLLTEKEDEICDLWSCAMGQGMEAMTPRLFGKKQAAPSHFRLLLKVCTRLFNLKEGTEKWRTNRRWAISKMSETLQSQCTSQWEIEQVVRLFEFSTDADSKSQRLGAKASHFMMPLLRKSTEIHAHNIFLIKELCNQTAAVGVSCLKEATTQHLQNESLPMKTPAPNWGNDEAPRRRPTLKGSAGGNGSLVLQLPPKGKGGRGRAKGDSGGASVARINSSLADRRFAKAGKRMSSMSLKNLSQDGSSGAVGGRPNKQTSNLVNEEKFPESQPDDFDRESAPNVHSADLQNVLEQMARATETLANIAAADAKKVEVDESFYHTDPGLKMFLDDELKLAKKMNCCEYFYKQGVTLEILLEDFSRSDLAQVGIPVGPAAKIWRAVLRYRTTRGAPSPSPSKGAHAQAQEGGFRPHASSVAPKQFRASMFSHADTQPFPESPNDAAPNAKRGTFGFLDPGEEIEEIVTSTSWPCICS